MARRRRKVDEAFFGALLTLGFVGALGLTVLAFLGYVKDNVVDCTKPGAWGSALAIVAALVIFRAYSAAARRRRITREREQAEQEAARLQAETERQAFERVGWGVERAVKIATRQGWVSPHRLCSQIAVTDAQAQAFLSATRASGLLVQAINGRHYLPGEAERNGVELMR